MMRVVTKPKPFAAAAVLGPLVAVLSIVAPSAGGSRLPALARVSAPTALSDQMAPRSMRRHSRLRAAALVAKRVLGAVVLGVATILLIKREPDQHWSDPPIITMVENHDQAARAGAPPRRG